MGDRNYTRRLGLTLRFAGIAVMASSVLAGVVWNARPLTALAAPLAAVRTLVAQVLPQVVPSPVPGFDATPEPSPEPSARATLTPGVGAATVTPNPASTHTPAPSARRGGPLRFTLTGGLSLGERVQQSVRGDAASGTLATYNYRAPTDNAGLLARIDRRTATTTLTFSVPAGITTTLSNLGELQAGYYTPKYALQYGAQPLTVLGGVPLGTTLRGLAFVLPLRGGDVTFFNGPAFGEDFAVTHVSGVRARRVVRDTLFEFGMDRARSTRGGEIDALLFGLANNRGLLNQSFEGALERQPGIEAGALTINGVTIAPKAYSYQYRADYGNDKLYLTTTLRRIADGFVTFGSGAVQGDDLASFGLRTNGGNGGIGVDESFERNGTGDLLNVSRRGTLSIARSFQRSNVTSLLTFSDQRTQSLAGVAWLGGASLQVGLNVHDVNAIFGAQEQRSTASFSGTSALSTFSGELQRSFGSLFSSLGYQVTRQIAEGQSSTISTGNVSLTRNFGPTALSFTTTFARTLSFQSDAVQTTPLLTISRRLSPAATLGLSFGETLTRDALNPSANGRSRIFGIQINAPFAIGNGSVQGRVDPRLPATISGSVLTDTSNQNNYSYNSAINNGVGNVVVVLDNNDVQRTDLAGHFQFNFVTPGVHQVRLESASLPRGITADQPFASITVLGGQQGQVYFRLGNYGAVQGHVFGRDSGGRLYPLADVALRVDSAGIATTGSLGAYGFGRLSPGTHVVSIDPSSIPASVSFAASALKQSVTIRNGEVSALDFTADPLGSIGGKLVYDASLGPALAGPVLNAYVVAEPGDHAGITDEQGEFLLDDLPAGSYTVDVDPETLPEETGSLTQPIAVTLGGQEHVNGLVFTIGHKAKPVVFTLMGSEAPSTITLTQTTLPPAGATAVTVKTTAQATAVTVNAFGKNFPLAYDKHRSDWVGTIVVPVNANGGTTQAVAEISAKSPAQASASLTVDPRISLVTFSMTPSNPSRGQYVRVRARFLADVAPGTQIRWQDGQVTKLGRPLTGRVYEFTVKISEQPLRGLLLTRGGDLPILLR
ncbi:MAG TPA: hypothetical protein VIG32_08370 [Candidatus Baltobacteraceae bacterium]|jgi:hypothetical protein